MQVPSPVQIGNLLTDESRGRESISYLRCLPSRCFSRGFLSCGQGAFRMPEQYYLLCTNFTLCVFVFQVQNECVPVRRKFVSFFFNLKTCFQLTLQHSVKARQTYLSFSLKQSKHHFFFWWSVALTEYHVGFCPHDIHFQSLETVSREQMRHMDSSYGINMYYGKFPPTQRTSRSALENKCLQCRKQALLLPLKQALPRGAVLFICSQQLHCFESFTVCHQLKLNLSQPPGSKPLLFEFTPMGIHSPQKPQLCPPKDMSPS